MRYSGVSLVSAGLAQIGLALGYGVLRWSTTAAVALSLATSVAPAYWLNRRHVWPDRHARATQALPFAALAICGSVVTALTTHLGEHLMRQVTSDHRLLTVVVNVTALLTTVVVWALRFIAFDHLVFANRHSRVLKDRS